MDSSRILLLSFLLGIAVGALAANPQPPQYPSSSTDWHYTAPNGTLLGHYRFDFWQSTQRERHTDLNIPNTLIIEFKEFSTSQKTIVVSDSVTLACCISKPVKLTTTYEEDLYVMVPSIPANATYVGERVIDGATCRGWTFVWPDDDKQVFMWMGTTPQGSFYPALLELPHNGRFVKYPWFSAVEPNESIWALPHYQSKCQQQTTCAAPLRYLLEERILASHMPQAMAW